MYTVAPVAWRSVMPGGETTVSIGLAPDSLQAIHQRSRRMPRGRQGGSCGWRPAGDRRRSGGTPAMPAPSTEESRVDDKGSELNLV